MSQETTDDKNNILKILAVSFFKVYYMTISVMFYAYIPIFFKNKGFSGQQTGILFSLQSLMAIATYLPSGIINDRFSVKSQIIFGIFIFTAFAGFLQISLTFWHFFAIFILWGLSGTILDNSTNVMYYKESTRSPNKLFFAIYGITSTIAYALGGRIGSSLIDGNDYSALFKTIFYMSLALLPLAMTLSNTKAVNIKITDYFDDILRFDTFVLAATIFIFTYHWGAELTSFTMFMKNEAGMDLGSIAIIYLEVGLLMSAIIFALGIFKQRHGLKPVTAIYIAVAASAGSQLAFCCVNSFEGMLFNQLFHAIGDSFFMYYWLNVIPTMYKYERIGGASSFVNLFAVISVIVGSTVSGMAVQGSGSNYTAFLISGLLSLLIYPLQMFSSSRARAPLITDAMHSNEDNILQ
ncbi:MAG TPA: MFS transporter, partial [Candidatus Wallbacteria bacterium]|nr:MFS transporter [Candidatus Wallbacteria bacterium]